MRGSVRLSVTAGKVYATVSIVMQKTYCKHANPTCSRCQQRRDCAKAWRLANPEANKKLKKEWALRNPERIKERHQAWRESNREKTRAKNAAWRARNRTKINKIASLWQATKPAEFAERSARKRGCPWAPGQMAYVRYLLQTQRICAVCDWPFYVGTRARCVDHDHKTGLVRGVVCGSCNSGIGHLGDDANRVLKAALYLRGLS